MKKIETPTTCPSCDSDLEWKENLLYCRNNFCPAKESKKVEHFVKCLSIKGLGPKAIEKLELSDPTEIYMLTESNISIALNSEKLAKKISLEIAKSITVGLQVLLPAFSIPLMGKSASEKLCKKISNINGITLENCKEAGLGPKVTTNLLKWLKNFDTEEWPFSFKVDKTPVFIPDIDKGFIVKETVCITGKLSSYKTKTEAKEALQKYGYVVKDSVTKDVEIVINESGIESAKIKKAKQNNLKIVTNIKELFGE